MGLGGGGGGGILGVGGAFVGTAEALEIAGDWAYAYSGKIILANTTKTAFEFTTGNYLAVVDLFVGFDQTGLNAGNEIGYIVSLNGTEVMDVVHTGERNWFLTGGSPAQFIIPSYTEVKVELFCDDATGIAMAAMLTGRIYRD